MRHDAAQRILDMLCECGNGGRLVTVAAVLQSETQLSARDHAAQGQRMTPFAQWTSGAPHRFLGRIEKPFRFDGLFGLAEVVESQCGAFARLCRDQLGIFDDVAQQAVADALVRHRPVLLLDRLDRLADARLFRPQRQRVVRGEPAHGLGGVEMFERACAPVAFQCDAHARCAAPTAHAHHDCGEQKLVDLRAIGRVALFEQRLRFFNGKCQPRVCGRSDGAVAVTVTVIRQRRDGMVILRNPVIALGGQHTAMRIGGQRLPPLLQGRCLGREHNRLASFDLAIGLLQIGQQDTPRHAVDDDVVGDQQQSRRMAAAEVDRAK